MRLFLYNRLNWTTQNKNLGLWNRWGFGIYYQCIMNKMLTNCNFTNMTSDHWFKGKITYTQLICSCMNMTIEAQTIIPCHSCPVSFILAPAHNLWLPRPKQLQQAPKWHWEVKGNWEKNNLGTLDYDTPSICSTNPTSPHESNSSKHSIIEL